MSSTEYWAFMIPLNIIIIGLAIGSHVHNKGWEPPRWLTAPWEHMVRIMEKPFRRKKPVYEPAGIIHNGEWHFGNYYAQATPNGTHHVWHHDEYLGEYHGQRIEIVEHLHAKDFPRTIEGSRATPEHHSVGGMTPHMCVCGKPLSQH